MSRKARFGLIKNNREFRDALNSLYVKLHDVEDCRSDINKKYAMHDILFLLVIGLCFGKNDPTNVHCFLSKPKIKRQIGRYLKYKGDIPSKQVFLNAVARIPPMSLTAAVNEWTRLYSPTKGSHVALDGKAVRGALAKIADRHNPPYNLNAVVVGTGLFALHEKVGDKTNEVAALPKTASMIELEGSMVTVDAAGTHAGLINVIISSDGHCLLPLKENQKRLLREVEKAFANAPAAAVKNSVDDRTDAKAHGRYEKRTHSVIFLADCPGLSEYIEGKTSFAGMVGAICRVVRYRAVEKKDGEGNRRVEESTQTLYYITDRDDITPEEFGGYAISHWKCETAHFILDVVFKEDLSTIRKGYGMENMSLLRKLAYNILTIFRTITSESYTYQRARDELFLNMEIYLPDVFKAPRRVNQPPSS